MSVYLYYYCGIALLLCAAWWCGVVPAGLGAGQLDHFYLVSSSTFLYLLTAPFAILLVSTVSRGGRGGGGRVYLYAVRADSENASGSAITQTPP